LRPRLEDESAAERVGAGHGAEDDHQRSQCETQDAEAAVNIGVAGGD